MMIIISILCLLAVCVGIYVWQQSRVVPNNRYRRTQTVKTVSTPKEMPQPTSKHHHHNKKEVIIDESIADEMMELEEEYELDALGIKPEVAPAKSPDSSTKVMQANQTSQTHHADCIVAIYLMAPEGCVYSGYELLQALLSAGMRYGKQRIFQRHVHKDGRGDVLFNCASAIKPGTFDLTQMGAFSSTGLCFFFSASDVEEPLSAFDCLLETIDQLVDDLGGHVLDENRILFTKERMVRYRQQIREFEANSETADYL